MGSGFATLVLMVLGAVVVAVFSKRLRPFFNARPGRRDLPRHLGTLMLNPKCSVAMIQAGQQTLLLGLTAANVTLLAKLPPMPEAPPESREEAADELLRLQ
jgi:flagellar biogenesis protein FliO